MKRPGSNQAANLSKGRVHIPPILLEGDDPRPHRAGRKPEFGRLGSATEPRLPRAYGTGKLIVLARDPHCLYAAWDFTDEQLEHHGALSRSGRLSLRVVESFSQNLVAEIEADSGSRHLFLTVPCAAASYVVQLGYHQSEGEWKSIRESAPVCTPPDRISGERNGRAAVRRAGSQAAAGDDRFPTIPIEEILARIGNFVAERCEGGGHRETIKTPVLPGGGAEAELSARLRRVYAEIYGVEDLPGLTAPSSFELVAAAEVISSPIGGWAKPERRFWFNVDAELIVYGATEPDAQVTMGGRPVQLRADGTFTCRLALPDGDHGLALAATSADRREVRYAELRVRRESEHGAQGG